jgi:polar amino acid transport system substrate-binding protein
MKPSAKPWSASAAKRALAGFALVLGAMGVAAPVADAGSLLERVRDRGELRAGTRTAASPFAFRTDSGQFAGFSVDLIRAIHRRLANRGDGELALEISAVTSANRLDRVANGRLDIVCGLTTVTWPRERRVDFTLPFFVDGTKLLTYREPGQFGLRGLRGKRVGVLANSTTEGIVADALPSAELVAFDTMTEAMTALENRRVAAIGNIGILLEKLRAKSSRSASLVLIPDNVGLSREPMACVVPEDESRFRDTVNQILSRMMTGLEDLSGPYAELYYQWFGVDGVLFYPLTEQRRRALNGARVWLR